MRWDRLRPVQEEAIRILLGDALSDLLIVSPTASGKTEAAFLPILTDIHADSRGSVRVLYIGAVKALINDQFVRLEPLCERGEIPLHRWHGDVGATQKRRLLDQPGGVLQITPESLELLLHSGGEYLGAVLGGLRWVVIDEVHAFASSHRGVQLGSLLERIRRHSAAAIRRVGLSATVGDVDVMRAWLRPDDPARVRLVTGETGAERPIRHLHDHHVQVGREIPAAAVDTIHRAVRGRSAIVFCNQRAAVEDVTVRLNQRSREQGGGDAHFAHHGSLSKQTREWVEERMRDASPTVAVATSTLELGIDIGKLDLVVQVNAAPTVSGFAQRAGRSGRREDDPRRILSVTYDAGAEDGDGPVDRLPFHLLHAAAVADLFIEDGWLEPPAPPRAAVNVLFQQMLMLLSEHGGLTEGELQGILRATRRFGAVDAVTWRGLVDHLLAADLVEYAPGPGRQLIVGFAAERLVSSWRVFAVFDETVEYAVWAQDRKLGTLAPLFLVEGAPIVLGGRPWRIAHIDHAQRQIRVEAWPEAAAPRWVGGRGAPVAAEVAGRARELLVSPRPAHHLTPAARAALDAARAVALEQGMEERTWFERGNAGDWVPWASSRAVMSALAQLRAAGLQVVVNHFPWHMGVQGATRLADAAAEGRRLGAGAVVAAQPLDLLASCKFDDHLPRAALERRWLVDEYDEAAGRLLLEGLEEEAAG